MWTYTETFIQINESKQLFFICWFLIFEQWNKEMTIQCRTIISVHLHCIFYAEDIKRKIYKSYRIYNADETHRCWKYVYIAVPLKLIYFIRYCYNYSIFKLYWNACTKLFIFYQLTNKLVWIVWFSFIFHPINVRWHNYKLQAIFHKKNLFHVMAFEKISLHITKWKDQMR